MSAQPQKPTDQAEIVALLAAKYLLPIGDVATLYEDERAKLALSAHVAAFVDIFATRNVLEILRRRGASRRSVPLRERAPSVT